MYMYQGRIVRVYDNDVHCTHVLMHFSSCLFVSDGVSVCICCNDDECMNTYRFSFDSACIYKIGGAHV